MGKLYLNTNNWNPIKEDATGIIQSHRSWKNKTLHKINKFGK